MINKKNILIYHVQTIITGIKGENNKLTNKSIRIKNNVIVEVGDLIATNDDELIDASDCVVYPAWVNTHHHLFQSLLKGIPEGLNDTLTPWLAHVPYRYRHAFNEQRFRIAVRLGLVEMALSGCGSVADHNYLYWPDMPYDPSEVIFEEAAKIGLRMILCRGGQTNTRTLENELPKVLQPESLTTYLDDLSRLQKKYADPSTYPMKKIVAAPTTPMFSMTKEELRDVADHARRNSIRLHSHLSETVIYQEVSQSKYGVSPVAFASQINWLGEDVWFAHLVKIDSEEIRLLGSTNTGVAHCPQSNGRLASGIAPIRLLENAGATISIGVDGAASNEAANMLNELHCAWLMGRAKGGEAAVAKYKGGNGETGAQDISIDDVIKWGTCGGAKILGLQNVGSIEPGMAADLSIYSLDEPRHFGLHDISIAPIASGGANVRMLIVNGRILVRNGQLVDFDLMELKADTMQAVNEIKEEKYKY